MTKKFIPSSLCRAIFDSELLGARLTLSIAELIWAVMLLWPGDTFIRPAYQGMSRIASESTWGYLFLGTSLIQLYVVISENYTSALARYFAAWSAGVWSVVVVSILWSVSPPPAAIAGEIALTITACWLWLRPFIVLEGIRRAYK